MRAGRILPCLAAGVAVAVMAAGPAWGAPAQKKGPVKVFILAGQSNMDGQADVRTLDFLGEDPDPARAALLKTFKPDGILMTRADVWVTSGGVSGNLGPGYGGRRNYDKLGSCIGPEYSFGYYMAEASAHQVLLIKYAPGGQSLYKDFRPPSAGIPPGEKPEEVGIQYRAMVKCVHEVLDTLKPRFPTYDEKAGYEIAGFVWFQGYNDMIQGGKPVAEYGANLACLIKDMRQEFKVPGMKGVVGVMGVNGVRNEDGKQGEIRRQMRSMNTIPEFKGNVKAVESAPLLDPRIVDLLTAGWLNRERDPKANPLTDAEKAMIQRATSNKGFHYNGEGRFFILLGKAFAEAMQELLGTAK